MDEPGATDAGTTGRRLRALAGSCHPGPALAVTVLSALLAQGVGLSAPTATVFVAAVFTGQLSIGWSNDWLDAARDRVAARRDKPAARGEIGERTLRAAAVAALIVSVVLSALLHAGAVALVLVAAGWAYNLGLKSTWLSVVAYAAGFAALPAAAYLSAAAPLAWWAPVTGGLLGVAAHVGNVLPDLTDDALTGVRGTPHRLGVAGSRVLLVVALLGAGAAALASGSLPAAVVLAGALVLLAGVAVAGLSSRRTGSPLTFWAVVAVALADVVLFVLAA